MIENNIINEVKEKPTAETADILNLKLELEREDWHDAERTLQGAQFAKAQRAYEAAEAEAQKAHEAARKLRLAELKLVNGVN